ncbi:hypothetical protein [Legionella maceachernii]|uniref:Transmembrane protein n=2 Tax=Legionella maceachernii TaxID=466 RepID=A0A0W0VZR5_9GAMM|nr:hypothetical protein [Legionella maceachernii]KTD25767.1 hypothetical protein Lmac_1846 [Legionella maceachernii]SJZ91877.1 hypothetical protein SAMN02745128_01426 [Legionella maceachernii]SUP03606.1 Uncharacterised protein [Legionella maceachernii]
MCSLKKFFKKRGEFLRSFVGSFLAIFLAAFFNYYFLNKFEVNKNLYNFINLYEKNYEKLIDCKELIKQNTQALTKNLYLNNSNILFSINQFKNTVNNCMASLVSMKLISKQLQINYSGLTCTLTVIKNYNESIKSEIEKFLKDSRDNPLETIEAKYLDLFAVNWDKCLNKFNTDFEDINSFNN